MLTSSQTAVRAAVTSVDRSRKAPMQPIHAAAQGPILSRADTPANRAVLATKFEGLVMAEMLAAMRAAKLDKGLFEGEAEGNWRRMSDQMLAESLAAGSPLGLAAKLEVKP